MVNARLERVLLRQVSGAARRAPYAGAAMLALTLCVTACAPTRVALPSDPGSPLSDYASIYNDVASGCSGVRSLRTEVSLSGSANGERLGGTLHAGFRKPESMRLELRAGPLGTPVFVLVANGSGATLVTRDNQVVRSPKAED